MGKWPVGGIFLANDPVQEQLRFDRRETVHLGPIFGRKTFAATSEAAAREAAVLERWGLNLNAFNGFGKLLSGTRRHNLVYVDDLCAACDLTGVRLSFTLPAGSYATIVLRELMKNSAVDEEEA
jgi:tRNA pseudouridine13 synthase